jgi:uncharacterized short protein YbdD (DUF466 family)
VTAAARQPVLARLAVGAAGAWAWLRTLTGDDAYERYLRHHAARHPGEPLLSARGYYEESQRRKWSGVSRCC